MRLMVSKMGSAGPFYVLNGCCTACGVPTAIAPELFDFDSTFCCPDFRARPGHFCIDPPFAKLIRGSWFAKVVVMSERSTEQIRELLDSLYRVDSGRILATLIRLLGHFDFAEEAMHEAFAAALSLWPRSGVPGNPRPWLIWTPRFKAIDTLGGRERFEAP